MMLRSFIEKFDCCNTTSIDDLISFTGMLKMQVDLYTLTSGLPVPDWMQEKLADAQVELSKKLKAERDRRRAILIQKRNRFLSREEQRAAIDAELAELDKVS